ncbi:Hypothetical predicted protein, partial [Marmota monax]
MWAAPPERPSDARRPRPRPLEAPGRDDTGARARDSGAKAPPNSSPPLPFDKPACGCRQFSGTFA